MKLRVFTLLVLNKLLCLDILLLCNIMLNTCNVHAYLMKVCFAESQCECVEGVYKAVMKKPLCKPPDKRAMVSGGSTVQLYSQSLYVHNIEEHGIHQHDEPVASH